MKIHIDIIVEDFKDSREEEERYTEALKEAMELIRLADEKISQN